MMIVTKIYPSDSLVSLVSYQNFQGLAYKGFMLTHGVWSSFLMGSKSVRVCPKAGVVIIIQIFFYHYDIALSNYFKDFIQLPATYENISENYSVLH